MATAIGVPADSLRVTPVNHKVARMSIAETGLFRPIDANGVLVAFRAGVVTSLKPVNPRAFGFDRAIASGPAWRLEWSGGGSPIRVRAAIDALRRHSSVRWAEVDALITAQQVSWTEPEFHREWALENTGQEGGTVGADIDAPEAWNHIGPFAPIEIAILDTGVDANHLELAHAVTASRNFVPGAPEVGDWNGHGTMLAGVIAMNPRNMIGGAGTAPNATISSGRILNAEGVGLISDALRGLEWARTSPARIINLSWATSEDSLLLRESITACLDAGKLIVTAAGNHGQIFLDYPAYPAAYRVPGGAMLVIGASNRFDQRSRFSAHGAGVDLLAPGENILTTQPWNRSAELDDLLVVGEGTSLSTAFVSGAAAWTWGLHPDWTATQVANRIRAGADVRQGMLSDSEYGRLNMARSLAVDDRAPSPPDNFIAERRTATSITLSWRCPADDLPTEPVSRFEIGYDRNFADCKKFEQAGPRLAAFVTTTVGSRHEWTIKDLRPGVPIFIAIRSQDEAGNVSEPVVIGPVAPLAPIGTELDLLKSWRSMTGTWAQVPLVLGNDIGVEPNDTAWSDSPNGLARLNADDRLELEPTLIPGEASALVFRCNQELEEGPDTLALEISVGGGRWMTAWEGTGQRSWRTIAVPLPMAGKQPVRLRFRLRTDGVGQTEGVAIRQPTLIPLRILNQWSFDDGSTWTREGNWGLSTINVLTTAYSWSDSPMGNYGDNLDVWTRMPRAAVRNAVGRTWLTTGLRYEIEPFYDHLKVLHRAMAADEWEILDTRDGTRDWHWASWLLPDAPESDLAFRLETDASVVYNGVSLDEVTVVAEPELLIRRAIIQLDLPNWLGSLNGRVWRVRTRSADLTEIWTEVTSDAGGRIFMELPPGPQSLALEGQGYLRAQLPDALGTSNLDVNAVALIAGDADGDNAVTVFDYDALCEAFDSSDGSARWNPTVDFNGDGEITVLDYDLLSLGFDRTGAP